MLLPARFRHKKQELEEREKEWAEVDLQPVDEQLLGVADAALQRELESRNSLNTRLAATITFAGALLAAAFTLSRSAAGVKLKGAGDTLLSISFAGAIGLLALAILIAIYGVRPEGRVVANPEVLRHYGRKGSPAAEVRADSYRTTVAILDRLGAGNTLRGRSLVVAQYLVAIALVLSAAGALTLFFYSS